MSKKKRPFSENGFDKFDLGNAASARECTGLIQVPPQTVEEEEGYMEIYDYQPPIAPDEQEGIWRTEVKK